VITLDKMTHYVVKKGQAWLFAGHDGTNLSEDKCSINASVFPGAIFDLFALEMGSVNVYYTLKYKNADFYIYINEQQLEQVFDKKFITSNKIWDSLNA